MKSSTFIWILSVFLGLSIILSVSLVINAVDTSNEYDMLQENYSSLHDSYDDAMANFDNALDLANKSLTLNQYKDDMINADYKFMGAVINNSLCRVMIDKDDYNEYKNALDLYSARLEVAVKW